MHTPELDLSSYLPELLSLDKNVEIPKLRRKFWKNSKTQEAYGTVRYKKNEMQKHEYNTLGRFRSLVFKGDDSRVVSYAPPKSYDWNSEDFCDNWSDDIIQVEEFVEGTMINLFWDKNITRDDNTVGDWEIATRSCVAGNVGFYLHEGSKTFRTMFLETCNKVGLEFDYLPKTINGNQVSYSFIMQHTDNRIVESHPENQLYLAAVYEIIQTKDTLKIRPYNIKEDEHCIYETLLYKTCVKFPMIYCNNMSNKTDIDEYIDTFASRDTPYSTQGVVFNNVTRHTRAKIRNPSYEEVRRIRGNQPKIQYRYLALRQKGGINEYLKYYPEDKPLFTTFRSQLHEYTNNLYTNYVNCFIKKQKPVQEFPYQYRNHMVQLHKKYTGELRDKTQYITRGVVISYVNSLPPPQQMFVLNYELRDKVANITAKKVVNQIVDEVVNNIDEDEDSKNGEQK